MTNLNTNPYYDDYDESKGFHQILFKPSLPVQARELTQLQSILRNQIARFGSHIFKEGSVVIPGNVRADLSICFVKLKTTSVDIESLLDYDVEGTSGLKAKIRAATAAKDTDPATLFVSYYNTGTAGEKVFGVNETLTIGDVIVGEYTVETVSSGATGGAAIAYINDGVFFVRGTFAKVNKQHAVISKYSPLPSCHVLLKITESIVDYTEDETLLDTAQGSYNYAAPGADRLKIELDLVTLPLESTITNDYVELMRYNEGILEEHLKYPKYNELEKSLARRTYDESGDYVVEGLRVSTREHLLSTINGGKYPVAQSGDASKFIYTVSPGKAYIRGFEQEIISNREIISDKARGASHISTGSLSSGVSYGQYLYVTTLTDGFPDFSKPVDLALYDLSSAGTQIGTATAIAIDYLEPNTTDSNAVFKLFISKVNMTGGNTIASVGRVTFTGGSFRCLTKYTVVSNNSTDFVLNEIITFSTRLATVHKYQRSTNTLYVFKHAAGAVPVVGDTITAPSTASARITASEVLGKNLTDNLLIELNSKPTYTVKNAVNTVDMNYKIYYSTQVSISAGGIGSFSVTGMTIDPKEQGNFIAVYTAVGNGVVPLANVTVAGDGLSVSFSGCTASSTLRVVCAATKIGSQSSAKTKTLSSIIETGVASSATVTLKKADGVALTTVLDNSSADVTSRYEFFNGQTDYAYERPYLKLKVGAVQPTGPLSVTYTYFTHNAGSGDYFSVDSYTGSGMADYYESPLLVYTSPNTGKTYDLRETLDFRPRVGEDGTFAGTGNLVSRLAQVDSRITTSVQSYVGRRDRIVFDKDGELRAIIGNPSKTPLYPSIPDQSMLIANITVPAYTYKSTDITVNTERNEVFTMKDIGDLEKRVENLEEYVTLTQTETDVVNYDIIDANTGLSRFKSGYLVETFINPDTISDIYNEKFKVSYVSENIVPMFETIEVPLTITSSTAFNTNGQVLTLPYTDEVLAKQPISSRITNINPFAVFSWVGILNLLPSVDTWSEVENLPPIINNRTTVVTITRPWNWQNSVSGWVGTNVSVVTPPTPVPAVSTKSSKFKILPKLKGFGSNRSSGGGRDGDGNRN